MTAENIEAALAVLEKSLGSPSFWTRVHAAEALIDAGLFSRVRAFFVHEWSESRDTPRFRVGVMRILANTSTSIAEKAGWIRRLCIIARDEEAQDRIYAIESLAKLRHRFSPVDSAILQKIAKSKDTVVAVYSCWALFVAGDSNYESRLAKFLQDDNADARLVAAYALSHLSAVSGASREAINASLIGESVESPIRAYLISAAYAVDASDHLKESSRRCRAELVRFLAHGGSIEKRVACEVISEANDIDAVPALVSLLQDDDEEVRVAAAHGAIRFRRSSNAALERVLQSHC